MVHSTSALVVTRSIPGFAELHHVTDIVSSYVQVVDVSGIPFARACALNSLPMAQRIWDSCPEVDQSKKWARFSRVAAWISLETRIEPAWPFDAHGKWSLAASLRCDRHYNRYQFENATVEAAKHGNLELLQWIFEHFVRCEIPVAVAEEAAKGNHRGILQYLEGYEQEKGRKKHQFEKPWRVSAIAAAGEAGHSDLVHWMTDGERLDKEAFGLSSLELVLNAIAQTGDLDRLKRAVEVFGRLPSIDFVAEGGNVQMLEWVLDQGHTEGEKLALKKAAAKGHLPVVQWLVRKELIYCEDEAVNGAAANGHLPVVQWLVEKANIYNDGAFNAAVRCEQSEVIEYLVEKKLAKGSSGSMCAAAEAGRMDIVTRLYSTFGDLVDVTHREFLSTPKAMKGLTPIDVAARCGHLSVLKNLHEIGLSTASVLASSTVGSKRKREGGGDDKINRTMPTCTDNTMRMAIEGGHIEVVKWLREHCKLEPAKNSIDGAAQHGQLAMVKWLHRNTNCGCTVAAMNEAARMGHLRVVRWLHENRSEGCTTSAMDGAAMGGHFDVLLFLHYNRSEGCSDKERSLLNAHIYRWTKDNEVGSFHFD